MRAKLIVLAPCAIRSFCSPRIEPRLSDGRMKPNPMRPRMPNATTTHSGVSRCTTSTSANDAASSASPMLTSTCVGWRSARRPTSAIVTASARPEGNNSVPTCEADNCSPSCIYTGSR